jgi:hypothetical protein
LAVMKGGKQAAYWADVRVDLMVDFLVVKMAVLMVGELVENLVAQLGDNWETWKVGW